MSSIDPLLIPVLGVLLPLVIVPVAIGMKHARLERELEHVERIKALELGRALAKDEPWWSPARISVAIGAGVPVGVFLCATIASASIGYEEGVWVGATAVGTTAVICGSLLAARHFTSLSRSRDQSAFKPPIDADAFDVVGRRG